MSQDRDLINKCRKLFEETKDTEYVLAYLRDNKYSKIESMSVLIQMQNIGLEKAKKIVHHSKTWANTYCRDEKIHDVIQKVLTK